VSRSPAYLRAVALAALALLAALLFGQPALVAVAAPFLLVLLRPPGARDNPQVRLALVPARVEQGRDLQVVAELDPVAVAPWGLLRATLTAAGEDPGSATWIVSPRVARRAVTVRPVHLGTHDTAVVSLLAWDAPLLRFRSLPPVAAPQVRVLPPVSRVAVSEALPAVTAYVGEHRARQSGTGIEFAGVRPFLPGDRPRQVNWRLTARTGRVHVTTVRHEHSVRVGVLVDSTCSGALGRALLDVTAPAALGLASSYLDRGDAVAMVEFGARDRQLPFVSGRANAARIQDWLADVKPKINAVYAAATPRLPRGVGCDLVIAVSPLLEETAAEGLVRLRQQGVPVVVLAVLPAAGLALATPGDPVERVAEALWLMARERMIHGLRRLGVPVVVWNAGGDLDQALRTLARQARAPRLVLR
jgi:uncharacterized protein (DUF58 family)